MSGFVYFIRSGDFVKIGYSLDPVKRLAKIGTDSPYKCEIIGIFASQDFSETEMHRKFSHLWSRGEWFLFDQSMIDFASEFGCDLQRKITIVDNSNKHPLQIFSKDANVSIGAIAEKADISRNQLYRIMNGENTTTDTLSRISEATGGGVTIKQLVEVYLSGRAA